MATRPEHCAPPDIFYSHEEAKKYSQNTRMIKAQLQMCERALELLLLPPDESCLLLDIGCGSGFSGGVLDRNGHIWMGIDISIAMLNLAITEHLGGDLLMADMGQGIPFRAASFDGAISISALQWICNIDKTVHRVRKRLQAFFGCLFACLSSDARAVFQFYPENEDQISLITHSAMKAGFSGGTVIDYPNSKKAKKVYLVLMTGNKITPKGSGRSSAYVKRSSSGPRIHQHCSKEKSPMTSRRERILQKKERLTKKGYKVKRDSKYSGRRRHDSL